MMVVVMMMVIMVRGVFLMQKRAQVHDLFAFHRYIDKAKVSPLGHHFAGVRQVAQLSGAKGGRRCSHLPFCRQLNINQFQSCAIACTFAFQRHTRQTQVRHFVFSRRKTVDELLGQHLKFGGLVLGFEVAVQMVMGVIVADVAVNDVMWHWTNAFLRIRHVGS